MGVINLVCLPPEIPTLQKLLCFLDKKLNITEQIGVNYFAFSTFLVEDSNRVTVKALEMNIFGMRPISIIPYSNDGLGT